MSHHFPDHVGRVVRFDMNGGRVKGLIIEQDGLDLKVRGDSGKVVSIHMFDDGAIVDRPRSKIKTTTIWREDFERMDAS